MSFFDTLFTTGLEFITNSVNTGLGLFQSFAAAFKSAFDAWL